MKTFITKKLVIKMDPFRDFLETLFQHFLIPDRQRRLLSDPKNLVRFVTAFTHDSYDSDNNYVVLSMLGHETLVKAICWYFPTTYPTIFLESFATAPMGQLPMYYDQNNKVGAYLIRHFPALWDFIRIDQTVRLELQENDDLCIRSGKEPMTSKHTKTEIVQKVLEATLAVVETAIDDHYSIGVGDTLCRNIVWTLMRKIKMPSLYYQDLVDPSTLINNHFNKDPGNPKIRFHKGGKRQADGLFHVEVFYQQTAIGEGVHVLNEAEAKREAARIAWRWINDNGIEYTIKDDWRQFHRAIQTMK